MTGRELSARTERARNAAEAEHLNALARAWQEGIEDAARLLAHAVTAGADWQPSHGDPLETAVFGALAAKLAAKIGALRLASMRTVAKSLRVRIRSLDAVARQNDLTEARLREAVGGELHRLTEQAQSQNLSSREASTLIQEGIVKVAPARAEMLARTELNALANHASLEAAASTDVRFKGWISARDPAVRDPHAEADGQIVPIEAQFVVCGGQTCDAPGDPALSDDCLCNCFPAETLVEFPGLRAATKRWYDGDLVAVALAGDDVLAGTPNHPVLRSDGLWVPLGEIKEGDYLVRASLSGHDVGAPDEERPPAKIGEVYDLAQGTGNAHRVRLGPLDFHGDGGDGEVDVVAVDGSLLIDAEAASDEQVAQFGLAVADLARAALGGSLQGLDISTARVPLPAPATSSIRSRRQVAPLVNAHAGEPQSVGFGAGSRWQAEFDETGVDDRSTNADRLRNRKHTLPAVVSLAQVVKVDRRAFHGDVFNLDTGVGYYTANGILCGNCRCTLVYGQTLAELEGLLASAAPSTITAMATASGSARPAARRRPQGAVDTSALAAAVEPVEPEAIVAAARALPFSGVAAVEGVLSDDNTYVPRVLLSNSLTWPELPVPLMAQTQTAEGHDGAEIAGRIDRFSRSRDKEIRFGGEFTTPFGIEQIVPMVEDKTLRFVSVDLGASEFTLVFRDDLKEVPDDAASMEDMQAGKYALGLKFGKVKAATLVPTPALGGTEIALTASADGTEARLTFPAVLAFGALADEDEQAADLDSRLSVAVGTLAHVTEMAARLDQAERRAVEMTTLVETVKDEHRQETLAQKAETLAMIESLTARIAAGEQISEAMLAAVGQLTERKPRRIEVERDEHGRPTAYLEG